MPLELDPVPPQPDETEWTFVRDLRVTPYHQPVVWSKRTPAADEAHFPGGVRLECLFDDPLGLLATAYDDFRYFLQTGGLAHNGAFSIVTRRLSTDIREECIIRVSHAGCAIGANDTESIRRGLVWLEEEMLRRGGPFLPLGEFTRTPVIRTRIARCFYGPINRPPKCRDELADDVDYYPDEYLNRLAHEGVNALWFTVHFFQTVPSKIIPEYGRNARPRLAKLRQTVRKCERYGIRIYPFCIEPAAFTWPYPEVQAAAKAHPDVRGHAGAFCTSTEKGQAYLEEATRTLFSEVPRLGGLIVIPVGERFTHCYSSTIPAGGRGATPNTCPRCSRRKPWQVLCDTLSAMARGMHSVNPDAELIAWPYGQLICWGAEATVEAARHIPPDVILQHNFETGGRNRQLGKWRPTWDYWLSYVGPSKLFARCARAAKRRGVRMSAKLQVGCSHEVATTQVVPAPGILYEKYRKMRRLGVSAAMHSWYFGTYPSIMTKAAGELAFDPWKDSARDFLVSLAQRDWGKYALQVVEAWQWFEKSYTQYPTAHIFGYYGPMHDGPAWPLYLIPRRKPLAPTWQIGYPPSGDYIAECIANGFTLAEVVTLCRRMAQRWDRGVRILNNLIQCFNSQTERLKEIGLATALGIQFRSGYNILRFYQLREQLAEEISPARRLDVLRKMRRIVKEETQNTDALIPLAEADSRLGFHSEAEGYKYYPELLRWRKNQLQRLLDSEFPEVAARAAEPGAMFPDYTGERPAGVSGTCMRVSESPLTDEIPHVAVWDNLPAMECEYWLHQVFNPERWKQCGYDAHDHLPLPQDDQHGRATVWKSCHDGQYLYIAVFLSTGNMRGSNAFDGNSVHIAIEYSRTRPRMQFHIQPDGTGRCFNDDGYIPREEIPWRVFSHKDEVLWSCILQAPLVWPDENGDGHAKPLRVNVLRLLPVPGKEGIALCSWANIQPVKGRLVWGYFNPDMDLGWLLLR